MSTYSHDPKKFADSGLQLRLPVDVIPPNQYSRLTNALPVIEGRLQTRDGMTLLGSPVNISMIEALGTSANNLITEVGTANPHGLYTGESVILNLIYLGPGVNAGAVTLGSYTVTVQTIVDSTDFTFTPGLPSNLLINIAFPVFGQVIGSGLTTLTQTPITNLFRLNEAVTTLPGDLLAVTNGRFYHAALPAENVFEEIVPPLVPGAPLPLSATGRQNGGIPFSITAFRFTLDSASWAILTDGNQMLKYRPGATDSQIEFVPLGNAPPLTAATSSAGGTGNLNSTGGTGYDWRYTYQDGLALTESNPSPIDMSSGGTSTSRPTAFTNPYVPADDLFTSPNNAIDGSATTYSTGTESASSDDPHAPQTTFVDCSWQGIAQPSGTVSAITLNVICNLSASVQNQGLGVATATASITYSYDGGTTFHSLISITANLIGNNQNVSTGLQTYSAVIPSSISPTNIIVLAKGTCFAKGQIIQGEQYSASANLTILVYDINTSITQTGSVNALSLTNQIGLVCVTPSPYPQHTFINLYRRGGSLTDAWRLVGQFAVNTLAQGSCGVGTLLISDNVSDTTLSTANILQLDNDQPVSSVSINNQPLSFIWGPAGIDVRLLGCGDPARPESVYFSKPGNADAWPPENYIEVSEPGTPIIAGCTFNTRIFAFSRETIHELVEGLGTGTTYTPFRTPSAHGLYTPWGLAVGPVMYFISKDGIYQTMGGQESSIVENDIKPLFPTYDTPGQSVNGYEAVDMTQPNNMRLVYHNDELYFAYVGVTTGTRQLLVYDILKKRWRAMSTSCGISTLYSQPATISSLLYGTNAGTVYQSGGPLDPTDLNIIENAAVSPYIGRGLTYYVFIFNFAGTAASGISYELTTSVNLISGGFNVTFPVTPPNITKWRVFWGLIPGSQDTYVEVTELALAAGRQFTVLIANGLTGVMPTTNGIPNISMSLRTGAHDQGAPLNQKQYGNVIFDLDPGGATTAAPVTITPWINGEVQNEAAITVTGTGRQQVPLDLSDFFAFNVEYEVDWTSTLVGSNYTFPILYQYDTLSFLEPVQVTHWEAQPTSFAFPGFVHVRDCYIAIRSTSNVTLTVTIDGTVTQAYTIPSTNGQRLKQYVQLAANKGLMYQFALDGTQSFRVYENDLEIRVKPWLAVLGYQIQRVLGGEAEA